MTAVPALKRGFEILNLLNQHETLSLEQIAAATQYPKASILRMLETMGEMGIVSKLKDLKQYRALSSLMPRDHGFAQRLQSQLHALAEGCDACVEWYEIEASGLRIAQRFSAPENEVQVAARVGFMRAWELELEAVAAIGLAFIDSLAPELRKLITLQEDAEIWTYDKDGEHQQLNKQAINEVLTQAMAERLYCDAHYNDQGVKRMAAPVFRDGTLIGVIAIAMSFRPQLQKSIPGNSALLLQCVQQLEK